MTRLPLLILAMLAAAPAAAQSIGEPLPGRKAAIERPSPQRPVTAARPCLEYGPGFVRVEGSSVCVRAGGSVRVDFGKSSSHGYGSSARGLAAVEARSETGLGPLRTVVQGQLRSSSRDFATDPHR